jgi:hypothetical protein
MLDFKIKTMPAERYLIKLVAGYLKDACGVSDEKLSDAYKAETSRPVSASSAISVRDNKTTGDIPAFKRALKGLVAAHDPNPQVMSSVYDALFSTLEPKPSPSPNSDGFVAEQIAAFQLLFPGFKKQTKSEFQAISDNYSGLYQYARFRYHTEDSNGKEIIGGISRIHPWRPGDLFMKVDDLTPQNKFDREDETTFELTNPFTGKALVFGKYLYQVGTDTKGESPTIVGFSLMNEVMKRRSGLVFRKHLMANLICGKILFKRIEDEALVLKEGISKQQYRLTDIDFRKLEGFGYMNQDEFKKAFAAKDLSEILNVGGKIGHTMLNA